MKRPLGEQPRASGDGIILIAGGSGRLGTQVVRLLTARGCSVRVLTRDPARARHLTGEQVEIVSGDVRDRGAVERAMVGVHTAISAIHGFSGTGGCSPRTVDRQGNSNLIHAAQAGAVDHFILLSIQGAAPSHPIELFRMKYGAEQELRASRLAWTIVRSTAFIELWESLIGEPLLKTGRTRLFGRGDNPINFVSMHDVARFVALAVRDPDMRGELVEVGGPENLSLRQIARTFESVTGKTGATSQVPLPVMRLLSLLLRPVKPALARQMRAAIAMDTWEMSFDPTATYRRYPSITPTSFAAVVRRDYVAV